MRRAAVSFCAKGVIPEVRTGSLVLSQQLAVVRPLVSRASLATASTLRGAAINSRKGGLLSARSGRFFSTQASARLSHNSRTTTPLLLANPSGIRFGTATKNAVRTYRVEGRPPRAYGNTLADAASGDQAAWLLIGGIAALGLGGIAVAGYLNQPVHTSAIPAYGAADLTAQRLRATYGYVVSGLVATGASAAILFRVGAAHRVLVMNPWLFLGASLLGTVGSLMAMQALPPERTVARHVAWLLFNACNGLSLSPVALLGGAVVSKALVATGAVVGSLSLVAAAAPSESFLWMGGGLGVGLGVLIAASMGQMFFPASAFLGGVTLYGGLGLFGLMMLYDTQRVMENAKTREHYDPMTESIKVYLNTINIFVRMATIMANSQNNRRR